MADNNDHIIRTVSLEINGPDIDNAFGFQEDASNWWHNELMPAISKELDSYGLSSDIIKIPRLEIEVDIKKKTDWQYTAIKQVLNHIKEQIDKHIANTATKSGKNTVGKNDDVDAVVRVNATTNFISVLLSYLETGILPWHTGIDSRDGLIIQLSEALTTDDFKSYRPQFIELLREQPAALTRFIQLIDNKVVKAVTVYPILVEDISPDIIKAWEQNTQLLSNNSPRHKETILRLSSNVLGKLILSESKSLTQEHFVTEFKQVAATVVRQQYIDASTINNTKFTEPFDIKADDIKEVKHHASDNKSRNRSGQTLSDSTISDKLTEKDLQNILEKNILNEQEEEAVTHNKLAKEMIREGIYISNAGLVLAAPFLNSLFEHTQLSADFKINSIDKVVCLTGYIASGKRVQSEFELVLPKVLCGIALDTAIDTNVVIEDEIYKEADEMLLSLIGHWSVLKDTSVEGLRESFLLRDGKLSFKNNEWLLQVEQKAYDMLLQQVPWNYQWVKLPWMTNLLKTEWVG